MTVTGWDNGLSQDYNKKLAQWFMSKPGAMHELRSQFMTTRTELIAELRSAFIDIEISAVIAKKIADMLEADYQRQVGDALSIKCYQEQVADLAAEIAKLRAAAKLALVKMNRHWHYEMKDALDALNEVLTP
jgi:protoheme ferro-lyase